MTSTNAPAGSAPRWKGPRPVDPLGKHGKRLWTALTGPSPRNPAQPVYRFRPDELVVLEAACHQTDAAAALRAEVEASGATMVRGSQGQPVVDGRLAEARLLEVAARQGLAQLKIPDAKPAAARRSPGAWGAGDLAAREATAEADAAAQRRRERAAKGAQARWHKQPANGAEGGAG